TSVFIITDTPPEQLGYHKIAKTQPLSMQMKNFVEIAGGVVTLAVLGSMVAMSWIANRREKINVKSKEVSK
ncbi:MAG: hypothetical protein QW372_04115, partial [Nitrososphaerales archaeon]